MRRASRWNRIGRFEALSPICGPGFMTSQSERPRPKSVAEVYVAFTILALQGFGGVLAFIEREMVERRQWLTREEFIEDWAVARTMPGPPALNLSIMIGAHHFGLRGALAAVFGMLSLPSLLILLLALAYGRFGNYPQVTEALHGMGAVAAGLIIATGLKLSTALKTNPMGLRVCVSIAAAGFACLALLRLNLVFVLPVLGVIGCVIAYRRVAP